jgi:hypothetical protein
MPTNTYAGTGLVFFLFAIFCAHWAQTTGRSAWLWFLVGWLFAPITGLFLLAKTSDDLAESRRTDSAAR